MNAIEFSQQKGLKEVITGHIQTAAIYCFGRHATSYSSSRILCPDKAVQKEHIHLYLLVFVYETIENAASDISDKIKTKTGGSLTAIILIHHVKTLKNPCHDQRFFFWRIMQEGELLFRDCNRPPYLTLAEIPQRNLKSASNYRGQRSNVVATLWGWVYNDDETSSSDEVKMAALHQIVEQTCLSLIRVFMGYTPNHFALEFLFMLCEYFSTITVDFFPRSTTEDQIIFNLLKQQPSVLRFSRCNDVDYVLYQLLEGRCGKFRKQADILIQNELERLSKAEDETTEINNQQS